MSLIDGDRELIQPAQMVYDADADLAPVIAKCPRESLVYVGKPSEKDLAAVADEDLPDRVEVDFKTTVDDTEYRG